MTIKDAQNLIEANPNCYWGFRAVAEDAYNVGDVIIERSKSWHDIVDSTLTDEEIEELEERGQVEGSSYWVDELSGVCATDVSDFSTAADALEFNRRFYCGSVVYLIASKRAEIGEDEHEIIMTTPEVVAKF